MTITTSIRANGNRYKKIVITIFRTSAYTGTELSCTIVPSGFERSCNSGPPCEGAFSVGSERADSRATDGPDDDGFTLVVGKKKRTVGADRHVDVATSSNQNVRKECFEGSFSQNNPVSELRFVLTSYCLSITLSSN